MQVSGCYEVRCKVEVSWLPGSSGGIVRRY